MIKRRFYRFEHGSRDAPSESSSSSESEVEVEAEASDDTEIEEDEEEQEQEEQEENVTSDLREKGEASSSSGYESEDSSVNEVNLDSSGLPTSDDDVAAQNQNIIGSFSGGEGNSLPAIVQHSPKKDQIDMADCVLKCKSVFKCKLCPRIVCLSEETLKAHLSSKKHARSEKLHKEGRLKLMLNDDGEIEGETHSENVAATTVSEKKSPKPNKKGKGRWKQRKRPRQNETDIGKAKSSKGKHEKRRKSDD